MVEPMIHNMSQAHEIARAGLFLTQVDVHQQVSDSTSPPPVASFEATIVGHGSAGAVLAMPWYTAGTHTATLTAASGSDGGTLEVWHFNTELGQLCLSAGYFGVWDEFRRITAATRFAPGCGLPGRVWEHQRPILLEDLTESNAFLRADAARTIGLEFGLGLPVAYPTGTGVVVLLSTRSLPIARSIDIWKLRSDAELDHVQSFSPHSQTGHYSTFRKVGESLALEAARQFVPLTTGAFKTLDPNSVLHRSPVGLAWPSRTKSGEVYVATLLS